MKKSINILAGLLFASVLTLSSCGGGDEKGGEQKVDTEDVKGTIDPGEGNLGDLNYNLNGKDMKVAKVEFEGAEFLIVPTEKSFEEEWQSVESSLTSFGSYEMIEKSESACFYKVIKDFAGEKEEGYSFLVWAKGGDKNYYMKGEGENPLKPIADKEVAEKAFKAAQTFKAE
jgi:hypothetical protein